MDSDNWRVKRDPTATPPRESGSPFQQRRLNDGGRGFSRPSLGRYSNPSRDGENLRKPMNDAQANRAIEEGRRLYVGNLPYEATVRDVETVFKDVASDIQTINMSVDPMTGRNPSYCFIDFSTKEIAQKIMSEYNGRDILRRPLKIKLGVKSGTGAGRYDVRPENRKSDYNPVAYDRWQRLDSPEDRNAASREGRRLYVGGLPRFVNQAFTTKQMQELFVGYTIEVISKEVSAHKSTEDMPGNHNYCFVDLASPEEAQSAIKEFDGMEVFGGTLRVNLSYGTSGKLAERRRVFVGGLPEFKGQEEIEARMKELFQGFEIKITSKLFLPKEPDEKREGNHCFCFVELADETQTDAAILELDWKEIWDGKVRVKPATSSGKSTEKRKPLGPVGWGTTQRD